jgi:hypothetical protein
VLLDVHDFDRGAGAPCCIRAETGCRRAKYAGSRICRGSGNLFSPLSPAVAIFSAFGQQASDAIQCAEQREHSP